MVMRCTVSYSGVPVGVLCGMVVYCVVGWCTVCYGCVLCVRTVYCVLGGVLCVMVVCCMLGTLGGVLYSRALYCVVRLCNGCVLYSRMVYCALGWCTVC